MLRIVPHTVPRVGRSYEQFPDGFELHLLHVHISFQNWIAHKFEVPRLVASPTHITLVAGWYRGASLIRNAPPPLGPP